MCLPGNHIHFLPALTFAHRSFWALTILALPAALILRLAGLTSFPTDFRPFIFAHRALCAAAILALPAALIFRLFFGEELAWAGKPTIWLSFFSRDAIRSLIPAARRNCCADKFNMVTERLSATVAA